MYFGKSDKKTDELAVPAAFALSGDVPTTINHRAFTLIGTTFLVFEIFFLSLWGGDYWFGSDIGWLGIPMILISAVISHFFLRWAESPSGCIFFSPIWKGSPPAVYWRLVNCTEFTLNYGARYIKWGAIDELALTIFGNVLVSSRAICGSEATQPDLLVKLPIGAVSNEMQQSLVTAIRLRQPSVTINKRLDKRLAAPFVKGTAIVQSFGAVFMALILLDLGQSTFRFLQMNKEYYLAQTGARDGRTDEAAKHFALADEIHDHPFPLSWVNTKLLGQGAAAAGVHQLRSEALWDMGRKPEAVEEARKAVEASPESFRHNLRLARLLYDQGDTVGSHKQIRLAIKNHKDSLLPRLYMLAELSADKDTSRLKRFYQLYLDDLTDMVFGDEPWWPPGGNRILHEVFTSEDVTFIFDRLLHHPYEKRKRLNLEDSN